MIKKLAALAAFIGISPVVLYILLGVILFAVIAITFMFCGGGGKPVAVAPVDQVLIDELNSRDAQKKEAALEQIFQKSDAARELSDEKRAELKQEIIKDTKFGKRVTSDDFLLLIQKAQEAESKK